MQAQMQAQAHQHREAQRHQRAGTQQQKQSGAQIRRNRHTRHIQTSVTADTETEAEPNAGKGTEVCTQ
eukprot:2101725-Pleurochrysis_carterae.AAC.1